MLNALFLATEGVEGIPAEHIAAKLAVPIAIVIFCGGVYLLLWANYGARKGALIYATAFFGFTTMLGIFWWFGAPGTPVATGLQNFPGQPNDAYQGRWHAMEPGSDRAQLFPATNSFDNFGTVGDYLGKPDDTQEELQDDPKASFLAGDLDLAEALMLDLYAPTDAGGALVLGGERRRAWQEAAGAPAEGEVRSTPFFTVEVVERALVQDRGVRVAAALVQPYANFHHEETFEIRQVPVTSEPDVMFALKDPGALWFPSAVWTGLSLLLFAVALLLLDRIEQREKREQAEVAQAEDLAVPIAQ